MAVVIGYFGGFFLIAFLIAKFVLAKSYEKKHGVPMSTGQIVGRTIGIGLVLMLLGLFGGAM